MFSINLLLLNKCCSICKNCRVYPRRTGFVKLPKNLDSDHFYLKFRPESPEFQPNVEGFDLNPVIPAYASTLDQP